MKQGNKQIKENSRKCDTCSKLHLDTDKICHRPLTTICNKENNYLYYDKKD